MKYMYNNGKKWKITVILRLVARGYEPDGNEQKRDRDRKRRREKQIKKIKEVSFAGTDRKRNAHGKIKTG